MILLMRKQIENFFFTLSNFRVTPT